MTRTLSSRLCRRLSIAAFVASGAILAAAPSIVHAQAPTAAAAPHAQASSQDQQLAKQLEELRAQVARLQTALDQQRQSSPQPSAPAMGQQPSPGMPMREMEMDKMSRMQGDMKMGAMEKEPGCCMGMDMHKGEMGMPPEGMKMPEMMMDGMGRMGGMSGSGANSGSMPAAPGGGMAPGGMNMPGSTMKPAPNASRSMSSLPGVPGASHLYHIGATGFFLDHPHVTFTPQQQTALNTIKERALLERGSAERRIEQGEQELWSLTGADQPDAAKIQAKVREIEQLRTNQRLAFIQAIGEATKLLTPEQRTQLLGMAGMPAK